MKAERLVCDHCGVVITYAQQLDTYYSKNSAMERIVMNTPVMCAATQLDLCEGCAKEVLAAAHTLLSLEQVIEIVVRRKMEQRG